MAKASHIPAKPSAEADPRSRKPIRFLWALLVLAGAAAYSNSFRGQFVFDDLTYFVEDRSLHDYWPPQNMLIHWRHSMRPLTDLTLAASWAAGQADPWGYHLVNLAVHLLAGLTLYGIARRTLRLPALPPLPVPLHPDVTAALIAGLWMLHPLQTQTVTYVVQRGESLMGLMYLLTLYCAIRSWGATRHPLVWAIAAVAACLLGMGSKQVMVTAPLAVLLYHRTFIAGSFWKALRSSPMLYAGLAATWVALAAMVLSAPAEPTAGIGGTRTLPFLTYAASQAGVFLYYLYLAVWPADLCIDYAWKPGETLGFVGPCLAALAMLAGSVWLLARPTAKMGQRACGFMAAWGFLTLAPTSSVLPITDLLVEHRMYLAMAGLAGLAVIGLDALAGLILRWFGGQKTARRAYLAAICCLLFLLGDLTYGRNGQYKDPVALWRQTIAVRPDNPRSHNNLGYMLARWSFSDAGKKDPKAAAARLAEGMAQLKESLRIDPNYVEAITNTGTVYLEQHEYDRAIAEYDRVIAIRPEHHAALLNKAEALKGLGRNAEALAIYRQLAAVKPQDEQVQFSIAEVLVLMNRPDEAEALAKDLLRRRPHTPVAHILLADLYRKQGRVEESRQHYAETLRQQPESLQARLGLAWCDQHRTTTNQTTTRP